MSEAQVDGTFNSSVNNTWWNMANMGTLSFPNGGTICIFNGTSASPGTLTGGMTIDVAINGFNFTAGAGPNSNIILTGSVTNLGTGQTGTLQYGTISSGSVVTSNVDLTWGGSGAPTGS